MRCERKCERKRKRKLPQGLDLLDHFDVERWVWLWCGISNMPHVVGRYDRFQRKDYGYKTQKGEGWMTDDG